MTTKFNKDMYTKMRAKKDEPLSNIGKKAVRITGRGSPAVPVTLITPVVSGTETTRTVSPSTSIEELPTPASKRPRLSSKDKEKVDSRTSTIWSDERLAVDRAHGLSLLMTSRFSPGCLPTLWPAVMFTDSFR